MDLKALGGELSVLRKEKAQTLKLEAIALVEKHGGLVELLTILTPEHEGKLSDEERAKLDMLESRGASLLSQMGLYQFIDQYDEHSALHLDTEAIKVFLEGVRFAQGKEWMPRARFGRW